MLQNLGDDSGGKAQPVVSTVSTPSTDAPTSSETTLPEAATTQPTSTTTAAPPTTAALGPTRDDAVGLLFDVADLPGDGWQNDTFSYEPIEPCGIVPPHQPAFIEGRAFARDLGQVEAVQISHTVLVYANDTEAAQVMEFNQTFATECGADTINIAGTDFNASFQACDPFSTCDEPLPTATADLLAGDEYVLQIGLFIDPVSTITITDQVYGMRVGRSIVFFEYIVPDTPSQAEFAEAGLLGIEAWGRATGYPR